MASSSLPEQSAGISPSPSGGGEIKLRADRFDTAMLSAIALLVVLIGVVVLHGDQVRVVRSAAQLRVGYLGPVGATVQNIYAVPLAGGSPQKLTDSINGVLDYDVLPTDGRIVYSDQKVSGSTDLYILDPVTNKSRLIYQCPDASCTEVAWRPDGQMIAFDRSEFNTGTGLAPGAPRIWLYDLTMQKARRLFDDNQRIGYMPRWSPDGNRLALWDSDRGGIVVYDFKRGQDTVIPAESGQVGTFSPDSSRIWFTRVLEVPNPKDLTTTQYATHIAIADISKTPYRLKDLIPDSSADDDTDPIWSPDSQSLYLLRRPANATLDQDKQIYQVIISTGQAVPIVEDYAYAHSNLSLNPAGDTLLFQRFRLGATNARPEVWTYHLRTKVLNQLADNANIPRWLP